MTATLDVATLRRVYENTEVMSLKRRFDNLSDSNGVLCKEDFLRQYWLLCPWARGCKTENSLLADVEAMDKTHFSFLTFLTYACEENPAMLLSNEVVNSFEKSYAAGEWSKGGKSSKQDFIRWKISTFVKHEFSVLENPLCKPCKQTGGNRAQGVTQRRDAGRTHQNYRTSLAGSFAKQAKATIRDLMSKIITSKMLDNSVCDHLILELELSRALQTLHTRVFSDGGLKDSPLDGDVEPFLSHHLDQMLTCGLQFESTGQLVRGLELLCVDSCGEVIIDQAWRLELPEAAASYIALHHLENRVQAASVGSRMDLDTRRQIKTTLKTMAEGEWGSLFQSVDAKEVEAELTATFAELASGGRKHAATQAFMQIQRLQQAGIKFDHPRQLAQMLMVLNVDMDADRVDVSRQLEALQCSSQVIDCVQSWGGFAVLDIDGMVPVAKAVMETHMVVHSEMVGEDVERTLQDYLVEVVKGDGSTCKSDGRHFTVKCLEHINDMEQLDFSFSSHTALVDALVLCAGDMESDALELELGSDEKLYPAPIASYIRSCHVNDYEMEYELVDPKGKRGIGEEVAPELLEAHYDAISAQVDAGLRTTIECALALSKMAQCVPDDPFKRKWGGVADLFSRSARDEKKSDRGSSFHMRGLSLPVRGSQAGMRMPNLGMPCFGPDPDDCMLGCTGAVVSMQELHFGLITLFRDFSQAVKAKVAIPLQLVSTTNAKRKKVIDERMKKLKLDMRRARELLVDEQKACEAQLELLKREERAGAKDKEKKWQRLQNKTFEMFVHYERDVHFTQNLQTIYQQDEVASQIRELESMERYRLAILQLHVGKYEGLCSQYLKSCADIHQKLADKLTRSSEIDDMSGAIEDWMMHVPGWRDPNDSVMYRLPCRPEDVLNGLYGMLAEHVTADDGGKQRWSRQTSNSGIDGTPPLLPPGVNLQDHSSSMRGDNFRRHIPRPKSFPGIEEVVKNGITSTTAFAAGIHHVKTIDSATEARTQSRTKGSPSALHAPPLPTSPTPLLPTSPTPPRPPSRHLQECETFTTPSSSPLIFPQPPPLPSKGDRSPQPPVLPIFHSRNVSTSPPPPLPPRLPVAENDGLLLLPSPEPAPFPYPATSLQLHTLPPNNILAAAIPPPRPAPLPGASLVPPQFPAPTVLPSEPSRVYMYPTCPPKLSGTLHDVEYLPSPLLPAEDGYTQRFKAFAPPMKTLSTMPYEVLPPSIPPKEGRQNAT